jgi:hypothetical protein
MLLDLFFNFIDLVNKNPKTTFAIVSVTALVLIIFASVSIAKAKRENRQPGGFALFLRAMGYIILAILAVSLFGMLCSGPNSNCLSFLLFMNAFK